MALSTNLGFPRIGAKRELKKAVEAYWAHKIDQNALLEEACKIRIANWKLQNQIGIQHIPSNDFSFYDNLLDTACAVGAVPDRYGWKGDIVDLDTYFAMARGSQDKGKDVTAMEMTKWFDTNYHYIVPEFHEGQRFRLAFPKLLNEFKEALEIGIKTRPILRGPITFLLLGKSKDHKFKKLSLLDSLVPCYEQALAKLAEAGAEWVQIDEPCLALDRSAEELAAYKKVYDRLSRASGKIKILLATYFEGLRENLKTAVELPISALHVDLVRAPKELDRVLEVLPKSMSLSLGVVDGRNIWKNDLEASLAILKKAQSGLGSDRIFVAPSCSLLHTPIDLDEEKKLDPEIKNWMAFAKQKLEEIVTLTRALNEGENAVREILAKNKVAQESRKTSPKIHNPQVKARLSKIRPKDARRKSSFPERQSKQRTRLKLPSFATTTIGSFPQTTDIRAIRRDFKDGKILENEYIEKIRAAIRSDVAKQEEFGLDVLVHGEPERNDMVEYFGEQLKGFVFTENGWVQSYGTRYVKPPVIFGDVSRPKPMTVDWIKYAQSLTKKPMKGMLTGPITILQWSFVRNDQPRSETAKQIALAIRDEVSDLEQAGIGVIQIDEPAIREGLPLRRSDWKNYLEWAVQAFRLSSSSVNDETQIHTHMCYSEFNDIIEAIGDMDADVITIEASRSGMELLEAFQRYRYPNEIGPGVYDIHSPRVPSKEEMARLLENASKVLSPDQLWVNPDCGLKTRQWPETTAALKNMVEAARVMREKFVKAGVMKAGVKS